MRKLLLMIAFLGAQTMDVGRGAIAAPAQIPRAISVCNASKVSSPLRLSIEAEIFNTADSYRLYLDDDRCSDVDMPVQFEPPYSNKSGVAALLYLLYGDGQTSTLNKRLYCICVGRIEQRSHIGVLILEKVEKVWASSRPQKLPSLFGHSEENQGKN